MPYERHLSMVTPGLLILLTDQSEESVKIINSLIDDIIQANHDGEALRNRCYISVIGYNQNVKELCSGGLRELDASPLRNEIVKRLVFDGVGSFVEVEVMIPLWVNSVDNDISDENYVNSIRLITDKTKTWSENHFMSPPPIVLDCSSECHVEKAECEINHLKKISTSDGCVLFFGCYSNIESFSISSFSNMPEEWFYRLERNNLNAADYQNGIFDRNTVGSIIQAITDR